MKIFIILSVLITLVSCGGKTGPAAPSLEDKTTAFIEALNIQLAKHAGVYDLHKQFTVQGGEWIVLYKDGLSGYGFHVINLKYFSIGDTFEDWNEKHTAMLNSFYTEIDALGGFNSVAGQQYYLDNLKNEMTGIYDNIIANPNGTYSIDETSPRFNLLDPNMVRDTLARDYTFSLDGNSQKDLESMGAKVEALEVAEMEDILVNYGLSSDRSEKLGKLMVSYNKIKTKRALTSREKDVFTKELTGLSFDKASSVLVEEGYDALVEKASVVNGVDPEAIKELLNEVI
jgi:hypothetical protein